MMADHIDFNLKHNAHQTDTALTGGLIPQRNAPD